MKPYSFLFSLATLIFLAACSQAGDSEDAPGSSEGAEQMASTSEVEVIPPTSPPQPIPIETTAELQGFFQVGNSTFKFSDISER